MRENMVGCKLRTGTQQLNRIYVAANEKISG